MPVYTLNVASQIRHQQTLMLCNVTLAQSSLLYSRRVGFSDIHPVWESYSRALEQGPLLTDWQRGIRIPQRARSSRDLRICRTINDHMQPYFSQHFVDCRGGTAVAVAPSSLNQASNGIYSLDTGLHSLVNRPQWPRKLTIYPKFDQILTIYPENLIVWNPIPFGTSQKLTK